MNTKNFFTLFIGFLLLASCSSIQVRTDYDTHTDFSQYKSFAFYKKGIDKAPISDLDKRRILRSIETELLAKGMTKSKNPDVLISIFTKAKKQIDVYKTYNPYYYGPYERQQITKYTEGTLLIDIIDRNTKKLLWQGVGKGALSHSSKPEKREALIQKFVQEILEEYPPND